MDDVSIVEGNSGAAVARFTVTLSEASPDPVTIQYHTAGGSATPGPDYTPVMGTRTFAANQTSLTIDVPIQGDSVTEPDESFFLNVSPVGPWTTLVRGQGKATITNDDTGPVLPTLSVVDKAEPEGSRSLSTFSRVGGLTITLSAPSVDVVTVDWRWVDGTALGSTNCSSTYLDYISASGTATFAPGVTSQEVPVTICFDDAGVESNEAFGLRLSNPTNATLARPLGSYVLLNDDAVNPFGPRVQGVFQQFFAANSLETPMVGDFDGDGRTDILSLTRQNPSAIGDVYVALSEGTRFGASNKWHDWFAISTDERVVIGDFDGDGKDDLATWLAKTSRQVYVARSLGTGMTPETAWLNSIGFDLSDTLLTGDADGDGREDLILFARDQGKVYVALSTGTSFEQPRQWHSFFAVSTYERPGVADLNGDGRADIITFATDSPTAFGDVYVALSDGVRFGDSRNSTKWHDFFAIRKTEQVRFGDLNGDGRQDFFTFLPQPFGQCYTALSEGAAMGVNVLWPERVTPSDSGVVFVSNDTVFVGDVNGDGKADIIVFAQSERKV